MKLKAFIKVMIKGLIRDFPIYIFCFAIFPIVMSSLYGYFQRELFKPNNSMEKISISIQNNDKSETAKKLESFLSSVNIKEFIEIKKEKSELQLIIPKGYEAGVKNNKNVSLQIKHEDEKVDSKAAIVADILERYNEKLQEQVNLQKKIYAVNTLKKEELLKEINFKIYNVYNTTAIKNKFLPIQNSLTSYEYYSTSVFSFMFIIVIMSLVTGYYKEKETGLFNRIISASLSKFEYFNYSLVTYFILGLLINIIYVAAFRVMGLSFGGSVLLLSLIVIGKSLMEATIAGAVIAFFKNKTVATMFLNAFILIAVTIGGAFVPIEKIGSGIVVKLSQFAPNSLIISTFKNYLLHNTFNSIAMQLAIFIGISVFMYVISIIKISIKWEA